MRFRMALERPENHACKPFHVLIILNDRNPFTVLVGADTRESLEHLVTSKPHALLCLVEVRQHGRPDRMCVQDCAGIPEPSDFEVEQRLGRGPPRSARALRSTDQNSALIALEDVRLTKPALGHRACRDGKTKWMARNHGAEVPARAKRPATGVAPPTHVRELGLNGGETIVRH